ncbi:hypothetical protein COOONC_07247, partial [Cooperia oncophora]
NFACLRKQSPSSCVYSVWINLAQYRPGDTGFENVFIFWLERHTMDTKADPLTIVIDMTGTSTKNMDLNIFKFILHAVKYYYPSTVHDIIIFESPPIFDASWKINPAHPQIHHVTKECITQFIDSEYLPQHMGGDVSKFFCPSKNPATYAEDFTPLILFICSIFKNKTQLLLRVSFANLFFFLDERSFPETCTKKPGMSAEHSNLEECRPYVGY